MTFKRRYLETENKQKNNPAEWWWRTEEAVVRASLVYRVGSRMVRAIESP